MSSHETPQPQTEPDELGALSYSANEGPEPTQEVPQVILSPEQDRQLFGLLNELVDKVAELRNRVEDLTNQNKRLFDRVEEIERDNERTDIQPDSNQDIPDAKEAEIRLLQFRIDQLTVRGHFKEAREAEAELRALIDADHETGTSADEAAKSARAAVDDFDNLSPKPGTNDAPQSEPGADGSPKESGTQSTGDVDAHDKIAQKEARRQRILQKIKALREQKTNTPEEDQYREAEIVNLGLEADELKKEILAEKNTQLKELLDQESTLRNEGKPDEADAVLESIVNLKKELGALAQPADKGKEGEASQDEQPAEKDQQKLLGEIESGQKQFTLGPAKAISIASAIGELDPNNDKDLAKIRRKLKTGFTNRFLAGAISFGTKIGRVVGFLPAHVTRFGGNVLERDASRRHDFVADLKARGEAARQIPNDNDELRTLLLSATQESWVAQQLIDKERATIDGSLGQGRYDLFARTHGVDQTTGKLTIPEQFKQALANKDILNRTGSGKENPLLTQARIAAAHKFVELSNKRKGEMSIDQTMIDGEWAKIEKTLRDAGEADETIKTQQQDFHALQAVLLQEAIEKAQEAKYEAKDTTIFGANKAGKLARAATLSFVVGGAVRTALRATGLGLVAAPAAGASLGTVAYFTEGRAFRRNRQYNVLATEGTINETVGTSLKNEQNIHAKEQNRRLGGIALRAMASAEGVLVHDVINLGAEFVTPHVGALAGIHDTDETGSHGGHPTDTSDEAARDLEAQRQAHEAAMAQQQADLQAERHTAEIEADRLADFQVEHDGMTPEQLQEYYTEQRPEDFWANGEDRYDLDNADGLTSFGPALDVQEMINGIDNSNFAQTWSMMIEQYRDNPIQEAWILKNIPEGLLNELPPINGVSVSQMTHEQLVEALRADSAGRWQFEQALQDKIESGEVKLSLTTSSNDFDSVHLIKGPNGELVPVRGGVAVSGSLQVLRMSWTDSNNTEHTSDSNVLCGGQPREDIPQGAPTGNGGGYSPENGGSGGKGYESDNSNTKGYETDSSNQKDHESDSSNTKVEETDSSGGKLDEGDGSGGKDTEGDGSGGGKDNEGDSTDDAKDFSGGVETADGLDPSTVHHFEDTEDPAVAGNGTSSPSISSDNMQRPGGEESTIVDDGASSQTNSGAPATAPGANGESGFNRTPEDQAAQSAQAAAQAAQDRANQGEIGTILGEQEAIAVAQQGIDPITGRPVTPPNTGQN